MSNTNKKSHSTKLRSNEMSMFRSQNQTNFNSGTQMDSVASGSSCISSVQKKNTDQQTKIISEPNQPKCGGRGMAIQKLCESINSSKIRLIKPPNPPKSPNSNLDFSNTSIERHFKNLSDDNLKKLAEENENRYNELISSTKKT